MWKIYSIKSDKTIETKFIVAKRKRLPLNIIEADYFEEV